MPDTDAVNIRFLINSDEVRRRARQVLDSVHGTTQGADQEIAKLGTQFEQTFKKIMDGLRQDFGEEKIKRLDEQLKGVTDAGEQFNTVLGFIRENIEDLKLTPEDSERFIETVDLIQQGLNRNVSSAAQLGEVMAQSFDLSGQSIGQLQESLDGLIHREELLESAVKNAHNPELLEKYKQALEEVVAQQAEVTRRMEEIASGTGSAANPSNGTDPADVSKRTSDALKAQSVQVQMLSQSMRGLFGVVSSTMLVMDLFGTQNDKTRETMIKLVQVFFVVRQASVALRSAQALGNTVMAAAQAVTQGLSGARAADATAAAAQTAAAQAQATATGAATVAQQGLNAAIKANPIGLLVLGLTAAITAIATLISRTKSQTEKQADLNKALSKTLDLHQQIFELQNQGHRDEINGAKAAVSIAQAQGKSQTEILQLRRQELQAEQNLIAAQQTQNREHLANLNVNRQSLLTITDQLTVFESYVGEYGKLRTKDKERYEDLLAQKEVLEKQVKIAEEINQAADKNKAEQAENDAAEQKARADLARDNQIKNAEAVAAARKEGTQEWLDAELKAIDTRERAAIAQAQAEGQTVSKIRVDAENERTAAVAKLRQAQLEDQINMAKTALNEAKKGSIEEFNARIALVKLERDEKLNSAKLTASERVRIASDAGKEINEIGKNYDAARGEEVLKATASNLNARLAAVRSGTLEELNIRKQLADNQADQDLQAARNSITNSEQLAARELEIHARLLSDLRAMDEEFANNRMRAQLDEVERRYEAEIAEVRGQSNNGPVGNRLFRLNQEELAAQININKEEERQRVIRLSILQLSMQGLKPTRDQISALQSSDEKLRAYQNRLQSIKDQRLLSQFSDLAADFRDVGNSLVELGSSLSGLNSGLSDTLQTIGQVANAAGDIFQGLSSGNPIGIISGVASGIAKIFSIGAAARESARKAQQELLDFQRRMIEGELAYNRAMRERARTQADITEMTAKELELTMQQRSEDLERAKRDQSDLLARIRENGQKITGEHTERHGGVLGIGRKTRVVQDTADLLNATFEDLERLDIEGKLTEETKGWFEQLKASHDEIDDINQSLSDSQDQWRQVLTGTTADSIADSIVQGFADGKTAVADFADSFDDLMRQSILDSLKMDALREPIKKFYEEFANASASGNGLDRGELTRLQGMYDNIITNAAEQFQQMQDITGLDFSGNRLTGLAGSISRSLTEDTANELSGLYRSQYDLSQRQYTVTTQLLLGSGEMRTVLDLHTGIFQQQLSALSKSVEVQLRIETHAANLSQDMSTAVAALRKIVNNTDGGQSARDLGVR